MAAATSSSSDLAAEDALEEPALVDGADEIGEGIDLLAPDDRDLEMP